MNQDNMRQDKNEQKKNVRSNGRVTRGFSNLPKEEEREPESSEESESEEE